MAQRILVAYYSMSGNTRQLAEEISSALGADREQIREPRPRQGASGVLRAMFDSIFRRKPPIDPAGRNPANYDLLVIGAPVWAGRIAAPARTYAYRYGAMASQVAFFCTEGGSGGERALAELESLCQRAPCATLVVDAPHLSPETHREELRRFTEAVAFPRSSDHGAGDRQSPEPVRVAVPH